MENRFKVGFVRPLGYGKTLKQQEQALIEYGVLPENIFRAPADKLSDAVTACHPGDRNILAIAYEIVLGRESAYVFEELDKRGADLYCADTDTLYPGTNGKAFAKYLRNKQGQQTLKARDSQKGGGGAPKKLDDKQIAEAREMLARGDSMVSVVEHFGVANNYFYRRLKG